MSSYERSTIVQALKHYETSLAWQPDMQRQFHDIQGKLLGEVRLPQPKPDQLDRIESKLDKLVLQHEYILREEEEDIPFVDWERLELDDKVYYEGLEERERKRQI